MQERTGRITALDELHRRMATGALEDRLRAIEESEGHVEIPAAELPQAMNRAERRAWASQQRKAKRAAAKRASGKAVSHVG